MTEFTARKQSEAVLDHERKRVWDVLVDPDLVAAMTPMVSRIDADGPRWRWTLRRIPLLGGHVDLEFTEAMTFTPEQTITFHHDPQDEERAGATG
ncbi:hypothetical protein [Nocardioides campestrisoli]|uniref:hypothetical protein n=1 Tax=Nocardioides campestrisoli TaxID=2736757 RepID=UPI0015E6D929|nr:hypothetical protein [Nocardioides campestrisoli]